MQESAPVVETKEQKFKKFLDKLVADLTELREAPAEVYENPTVRRVLESLPVTIALLEEIKKGSK